MGVLYLYLIDECLVCRAERVSEFHSTLNTRQSSIYSDKYQVSHMYFLLIMGTWTGFGDLEVACWPLVPKFAGSNPAEAVGILRAKKSSARLPSEGK